MEDPIAGDPRKKKKQAVADAINSLLYNLILRCTKEYVVKPYFHVGIWGYGGADEVRRVFSPDLLSITEVVERGTGGDSGEKPTWFAPEANGRTPMNTAFRAVLDPVERWIHQYPEAFPPIILNLTDGAYTDDSPAPVVRQLMAMGTTDGHVLVFNCHISKYEKNVVPFPDDAQAAELEGLARELYEMSSPLPQPMRQQAERKHYTVAANARGYAFNADLETMIDFLEIGTRAIRDRME
ncbi:MAG: VWA domain-containing protein [bacterium]|nr:VWA domain-containing protein [bacterium]